MDDRTITAYRPGASFPAVSVTGDRCDLMCDHCRGAHLRGMTPAANHGDLLKKASEIKRKGGNGMLISGGCDLSGRVPLLRYEDEIRKAAGMGLELNVHAGLVNREEAKRLVDSGISVFSVDVHQDPAIIKNVLHLTRGPEAYAETMDAIIEAGGRVVPHVTVGFGTADLILSAELLKSRNITEITLLALVPTDGTDVHAPVPREGVLEAVSVLTEMGFTVTLGCMRSRDALLEIGCIKAGVRKIANPSVRTVRWAEDNGFKVAEIGKCCSF